MSNVWTYRVGAVIPETLEFLTSVARTYTTEKRDSMRRSPRCFLRYKVSVSRETISQIEEQARQYLGADWIVPVWTQATRVGTVGMADTSISFDTTLAEYEVGGSAILWQSPTIYQVVEISAVTDTDLTFTGAVGADLVNALIMPAVTAKMVGQPDVTRGDSFNAEILVGFMYHAPRATISASYSLLSGFEVVTDGNHVSSSIRGSISLPMETLDNGSGIIETIKQRQAAERRSAANFIANNRAEAWSLRNFIRRIDGRRVPFWIPSYQNDIRITSDIASAATSISANFDGANADMIGRGVYIMMRDGSEYFQRITNAAGSTLTISAALGADIASADIDYACVMYLVRSGADSFEIENVAFSGSALKIPTVEVSE